MKLGVAIFFAHFAIGSAMAQCGRCGPDGGNKPLTSVPRLTYSPQRPLQLPDGLGRIEAQMRIDSLAPQESVVDYSATSELLLDAFMDRPVRLTEVTLRRRATSIRFGISATSPLLLPAGRSTVVLRGSTFALRAGDKDWTLFLRSEERPDGYSLAPPFSLEASEAIALAALNPPQNLAEAMVSVRASYVRPAANEPISAAELQYDVSYRAGNGAASITKIALRSFAAFGPILIENAIAPATVVSAGSTGTFSVRQILDPSNAAAMAGLESMLQNPSSLYVQLETNGGSGGALLRRPESFTYNVEGTRVATSAPQERAALTGRVTIETVRDEAGKVLAGLARFGLAARGFTREGTSFTGITIDVPPVRTLPVQSALSNPSLNPSGDTTVYQDYPLRGEDPLLDYLLTPATFSARLNTAVDAQGAMILRAKAPLPELASAAMAITKILPEVSTPGSFISIFGRSFPANASQLAVSVEGLPAEIYYASPTQLNVRISDRITTPAAMSPSIRKTLLVVNLPQATTASSPLEVDVAEPVIFSGPAIFFAGSRNFVRPDNPAAAGDLLDIYCTGITLRPDISYSVRIGTRANLPVVPQSAGPGVWLLRVSVPSGLAPGIQPVSVFATFDKDRVFPVKAQEVPLALK